MKLYTCTDHDCFWPVGAASIVIASNAEEAHKLLANKLKSHGLKPESGFNIQKVNMSKKQAIILCNGNY